MICDKKFRMTFDKKAKELVSEMTLEEKVEMMAGHSTEDVSELNQYNVTPYTFGGCKRLGIPELGFCDGPRGVVSGHSTCFPVAMSCGATFNRKLEKEIGHVIGKEVLANGGNYFGGVCMNIPYNPGAGRSQECFGEDSYHMGEMACALMEGVQDENVIACAKHFAFNSMEKSRFKVSVTASKRTEKEVFLPHFKKVIDAGAASVMNAYNLYCGKKCGHNSYLLRDILKDGWDFDGFVMSDFGFGVLSAEEGIPGGCDVEMNLRKAYTLDKVKAAIKAGKVTESMLDDACVRIVRTTLAFEAARKDKPEPKKSILACKEHVALARRAAEEGITLVQNKGNLLPLSKNKKIAVVGDLGDVENIGDHGSSMVRPPYIKTFVAALREEYSDVKFSYIKTADVSKHQDEIKNAETVIVFAGMNHDDEGEYCFTFGGDRESLELHKADLSMIDTVSTLNKNTAVVLMGGNVIMTHSFKDKVRAIIFAYYSGMEGGGALADIIFGKVNPSGKLPFAVAENELDYPQVNWDTEAQHYDYYHGYQKLDKENKKCDFPFGFGLSYTDFELSNFKLRSNDSDKATFEVTVKNIGERAGADVAELYVSFPTATVDRPVRVLMGFEKVNLAPGEAKTVSMTVNKSELRFYDEKKEKFCDDREYEAFAATDEQHMASVGIKF